MQPTLNILAISGSARQASTNTAFLTALKDMAPDGMTLSVFHDLHTLPVFSADLEGEATPLAVNHFLALVSNADGIIISSPEYVRAIPGGLKNAIDWMVSRFEVIDKPIALAHASHRGDDMLASLRLVLATISSAFAADLFLRVPCIGLSPEKISLQLQEHQQQATQFLHAFAKTITANKNLPSQ
jgi:chromate reductase